jgi:hypothetical protein
VETTGLHEKVEYDDRGNYRMPHLNKIRDFLEKTLEISSADAAKLSVNYAQAIVQNRVANELRRLNDSFYDDEYED